MEYVWTTPTGEIVLLDKDIINALELIDRNFPGAEATWWRPGRGRWNHTGSSAGMTRVKKRSNKSYHRKSFT